LPTVCFMSFILRALLWRINDDDETESTDQRQDSGRPKQARTEENVTAVNEPVNLVWHEDKTQTHHSTCQVSRETGLTQSSVVQIIHRDVGLKCPYSFAKMLDIPIIVRYSDIYISQGSV